MKLAARKLTPKDLKEMEPIKSGTAARIIGVDRRTFWRLVEEGKIKPYANIEGIKVYERGEIERAAKAYKERKKLEKRRAV